MYLQVPIHPLAQFLARSKCRDVPRWDTHPCSCSGITPGTGWPVAKIEATEAADLDALSRAQCLSQYLHQSFYGKTYIRRVDPAVLCNELLDKLRLVHVLFPLQRSTEVTPVRDVCSLSTLEPASIGEYPKNRGRPETLTYDVRDFAQPLVADPIQK